MFGVVLWSDEIRNRAVIWCEDHGDLAFFKGDGADASDSVDMDPGDLVQFEVRQHRDMRLACNPRLVATDEFPTLTRDLKEAGVEPAQTISISRGGGDPKIVAFEAKPANSPQMRRPRRKAV